MTTLFFTVTSANKREWNKWRRDTLLKLCSDAVDASYEAESKCDAALSQKSLPWANGSLKGASKAAARIGTVAEQLHLIGAHQLADSCVQMRHAADAINTPASLLRTARINAKNFQDKALEEVNSRHRGWTVPGSDADIAANEERRAAREAVHQQWLAEPESTHNTTRSDLDKKRATFIKRGRIELKSTT